MDMEQFVRDNEERIISHWGSIAQEIHPAPERMNMRVITECARALLQQLPKKHASGMSKTLGELQERFRLNDQFVMLLALRSAVLRAWSESDEPVASRELLRINDTIDHALATSVTEYSVQNELWEHANHDDLTGIPNRRLFVDRLNQDIRKVRRSHSVLALLYIDIDKFRQANLRLGHDRGDLLLKQVSRRIASCIRESDTVARMGGDEFAVLLVDAGDRQRVEAVARAILTRLSRPLLVDEESIRIEASIGISLYGEHGESANELLTSANQAMQWAKRAGGDQLNFFELPRGRVRPVDGLSARARSIRSH